MGPPDILKLVKSVNNDLDFDDEDTEDTDTEQDMCTSPCQFGDDEALLAHSEVHVTSDPKAPSLINAETCCQYKHAESTSKHRASPRGESCENTPRKDIACAVRSDKSSLDSAGLDIDQCPCCKLDVVCNCKDGAACEQNQCSTEDCPLEDVLCVFDEVDAPTEAICSIPRRRGTSPTPTLRTNDTSDTTDKGKRRARALAQLVSWLETHSRVSITQARVEELSDSLLEHTFAFFATEKRAEDLELALQKSESRVASMCTKIARMESLLIKLETKEKHGAIIATRPGSPGQFGAYVGTASPQCTGDVIVEPPTRIKTAADKNNRKGNHSKLGVAKTFLSM